MGFRVLGASSALRRFAPPEGCAIGVPCPPPSHSRGNAAARGRPASPERPERLVSSASLLAETALPKDHGIVKAKRFEPAPKCSSHRPKARPPRVVVKTPTEVGVLTFLRLPKGRAARDPMARSVETARVGLREDACITACRLLPRTGVRGPLRLRVTRGTSRVLRPAQRPAQAVLDSERTEVPPSGRCVSHRSARPAGCSRVTPSSHTHTPRVHIVSAPKEELSHCGSPAA